MPLVLDEYRTFLREARGSFDTIGAVAPSGPFLARSMASQLRRRNEPVCVLEVGPGTGALTWEIVRYIGPQDRFDIVELNAGFVSALHSRFASDWHFRRVSDRTRILHMPVQQLSGQARYDYIISGLPLNSFPPAVVQSIFQSFNRLVKPGGVLTFFEYLWLRDLRRLFVRRTLRRRLMRVGSVIERFVARHEFGRETVLINLPPAMVHHLRLNGARLPTPHVDSNRVAT